MTDQLLQQNNLDRMKENLNQIQQRNLALLKRLENLSYGANSEDSGFYLLDLERVSEEEYAEMIYDKTQRLLSVDVNLRSLGVEGNYSNIKISPLEITEKQEYPNSFVTFPQRVNIRTSPVPTEICGTANLFTFKVNGEESEELTQGGSGFPNTKALVLATTDVSFNVGGEERQEKWLYVRIHNLEGWVPAKETTNISEDSMVVDSIRPLNNVEKFGERLGIVTAFGLKVQGNGLVLANPVLANGELDSNNLPERGSESLGDGTMRDGENSVLTLGDSVEIVGEEEGKYIVKIKGQNLSINKDYINKGYLEVNGPNIAKILNTLVHPNHSDPKSFAPYGWGGEDGVNFDCSLMVDVLNRTFGITVARGADPQRFGVEGSEFKIDNSFNHQIQLGEKTEEYSSTLPLKFEDLPAEVQSVYDSENKIFTKIITVSCGPHIMVLHSIDEQGNIVYVHSVGFINKIGAKKGEYVDPHGVWSIVKGPAVYTNFNEINGDLELKENEEVYSWGDSYPPYVGWSEEARKAWPSSYIVIH